jgi:hypothetical protein
VFLSNILRKNLQKFCQLAAPKKLVRKNFWFSAKICGYKIFWICRWIFQN